MSTPGFDLEAWLDSVLGPGQQAAAPPPPPLDDSYERQRRSALARRRLEEIASTPLPQTQGPLATRALSGAMAGLGIGARRAFGGNVTPEEVAKHPIAYSLGSVLGGTGMPGADFSGLSPEQQAPGNLVGGALPMAPVEFVGETLTGRPDVGLQRAGDMVGDAISAIVDPGGRPSQMPPSFGQRWFNDPAAAEGADALKQALAFPLLGMAVGKVRGKASTPAGEAASPKSKAPPLAPELDLVAGDLFAVPDAPHQKRVQIGEHPTRAGGVEPIFESSLDKSGQGIQRKWTDGISAELLEDPATIEVQRMDKNKGAGPRASLPMLDAIAQHANASGKQATSGHIMSYGAIVAFEDGVRSGKWTWDEGLNAYRNTLKGERAMSGFDPSFEGAHPTVTNPEGLPAGLTPEAATAKLVQRYRGGANVGLAESRVPAVEPSGVGSPGDAAVPGLAPGAEGALGVGAGESARTGRAGQLPATAGRPRELAAAAGAAEPSLAEPRKALRDADGKVWLAEPGEDHADLVRRVIATGANMPDNLPPENVGRVDVAGNFYSEPATSVSPNLVPSAKRLYAVENNLPLPETPPPPYTRPRAEATAIGPAAEAIHDASSSAAFADGSLDPSNPEHNAVLRANPETSLALERVYGPSKAPPPPPGQEPPGGAPPPGGGSGQPPPPGGRGGGPRGPSGPMPDKGPEFAGNIRLSKYGPEANPGARAIAEARGQFAEERRGVQGWAETERLASELAPGLDEAMRRKAIGEAWNAEQIQANRNRWNASKMQAARLAQAATNNPTPETVSSALLGILDMARTQENLAGVTAEAGRALQILRKKVGLTAEADRAAASALDLMRQVDPEMRRKAEAEILKRFGGGKKAEELIKLFSAIDDPAASGRMARAALKPGAFDKLYFIWLNNLFTPISHMKNLAGNTAMVGLDLAETIGAAAHDAVLNRNGADRAYFAEAANRLYALKHGFVDAAKAAATVMKGGELEGKFAELVGGQRANPLGTGRLAKLAGLNTSLLSAEDAFFKTWNYRAGVRGLAYRLAKSKGLKGGDLARFVDEVSASPESFAAPGQKRLSVHEAAAAHAERQLFQEPLGKVGEGWVKFVNSHPLLRVISPFNKTPINIVKQALRRSPAALLSSSVRADIAAGGARRSQALSRIAIGSAVGGLFSYLTLNDRVTGAAPTDPGERNVWRQDGRMPYSIRLGDKWYQYKAMEPVGSVLSLFADIALLGREANRYYYGMSDETYNSLASKAILVGAQTIGSKDYLKGVMGMVAAATDPERYGEQWLQTLEGSAVPGLSAHVARTIDPTLRETRSAVDAWMSRIPGLREQLPPLVDVTGENREYGRLPYGLSAISPVFASPVNNDPVVQAVRNSGVALQVPDKKLDGRALSPREYESYSRMAGKRGMELVAGIMADPKVDWENLDQDIQRRYVEEAFGKAREQARIAMRLQRETPDVFKRIEQEARRPFPNLQRLRELEAEARSIDPGYTADYLKLPSVQRQIRRKVNVLGGRVRRGRVSRQTLEHLDLLGESGGGE